MIIIKNILKIIKGNIQDMKEKRKECWLMIYTNVKEK